MHQHDRPATGMAKALRYISAFASSFTAAFVSSFDKGR